MQKVESGMGFPDWHTAMYSLWLQRPLWIYCPGHTGVCGNERTNRLACTENMTSGLQLGRAEVLRGLRNILNMDRPEHHRGVEKGSGQYLCSTRQSLALFQGQPRGDCWETGRSPHGPFWAQWCYLELKLTLELNWKWRDKLLTQDECVSWYTMLTVDVCCICSFILIADLLWVENLLHPEHGHHYTDAIIITTIDNTVTIIHDFFSFFVGRLGVCFLWFEEVFLPQTKCDSGDAQIKYLG